MLDAEYSSTELEPAARLGVYVHFPWCVRKCPYCDFNSHELRGNIPESEYVNALKQDLETELDRLHTTPATTYIGGGTPSLIRAATLAELLRHEAIRDCVEVTMEANPGTLEHALYDEYRRAGVTRLSLGLQSFDSKHLTTLGRIHTADEGRRAMRNALAAGFDSVNGDLMYGLPQQSQEQALKDLEELIRLGPEHISWYQLTIEPNTVFGKRPPKLSSTDYRAEISDRGIELLAKHGYVRYEVSAYARDMHYCQHNVNYWRFGDYLGIGAGAHGKFTTPTGIFRTRKKRQPTAYLSDQQATIEKIPEDQLPVEFMMNALRLEAGVEDALYSARAHLPYSTIAGAVGTLREDGLMLPTRLALSTRGYDALDSIVAHFVN